MKFYLQLGLILLAFSAGATAVLAYVNSVTKPKIEQFKIKAAESARSELIPNAEFKAVTFKTEKDSLTYYAATDKVTKALKGYTFVASKTGYSSSSPIKTMVAIDSNFKVINIKVIDQKETPGLGTNCTNLSFTDQFRGLAADQLLVDKDGGKMIKALTGATITTRAVTNSVKEMIGIVKKDVESKLIAQNPVEVIK